MPHRDHRIIARDDGVGVEMALHAAEGVRPERAQQMAARALVEARDTAAATGGSGGELVL
jgi:hypothetical protein